MTPRQNAILVFNAGSSSIKAALYGLSEDRHAPLELISRFHLSGLRGPHPQIRLTDAQEKVLLERSLPASCDHETGAQTVLERLLKDGQINLLAVGHRVVHGGSTYTAPVLITDDVLRDLSTFIRLAPQHQPHNLRAIRLIQEMLPTLPQIACFDTAFHSSMPDMATLVPLPRDIRNKGVRNYGFHGLSYEYIAGRLPQLRKDGRIYGRCIVAHMGHGVSMCALKDGKSIATSMGFTALAGLPMGFRSGTVDPGILLYLLEEEGLSVAELKDLLYHKSGLYGLSGVSDDVRDLLRKDSPDTRRALDYFAYRINREIGSLTAALGGLDALVFTAGIGENSPEIRRQVCALAAWLDIRLDEGKNAQNAALISTPDSPVEVWVIPTNEEVMIARHTIALLP
ncbi:acetate/propionate family kinase [Luteithermobacter gelatinilyticus]|uniref:acetate/propionate family kinase n=1 Tax=Luteithermobacter gelatinilyticus TaxID=2582913 RepID=UPI001107464E|nr:acetate/propionate family kinase [Luteithermobacter gelatinilyticus]